MIVERDTKRQINNRFDQLGVCRVQQLLDRSDVSMPFRELALEYLREKEMEGRVVRPNVSNMQSHIFMAADHAMELAEMHGRTARRALVVSKVAIGVAAVAVAAEIIRWISAIVA